ncbi:hypothetical protein BH23ACT11_BH23ACT11_03670 [soil metagenome]
METEEHKRRGRGKGILLGGLRGARENAGMTLQELEEATVAAGRRVYRSTISALELGRRGAQPRTARVLARVLGVSVRELRGEPGTPARDAAGSTSPPKRRARRAGGAAGAALILYLDTSALVKLYIEEDHSDEVRAAVAGARDVATCVVAYAEACLAFRRLEADGEITAQERAIYLRALDGDWENAYTLVEVSRAIAREAGELVFRYSLRGFDAVHLASAATLGWGSEAVYMLTYDARLRDAAKNVIR